MDANASDAMRTLEVLVGEWQTDAPGMEAEGRTSFEWLEGGGFLVERSVVSRPEFPNSISVIGPTGPDGALQQHYFDSRGVARVYEMTLDAGTWTLYPRDLTGRSATWGASATTATPSPGVGSAEPSRERRSSTTSPLTSAACADPGRIRPQRPAPTAASCAFIAWRRSSSQPSTEPATCGQVSSPITRPKCEADGKYS